MFIFRDSRCPVCSVIFNLVALCWLFFNGGCTAGRLESRNVPPDIVMQDGRAYFFPLQFVSLKSVLLETKKEITFVTKSIPPRYGYKIKSYVYGIELTVVASTDAAFWDQPFALLCRLPDDREATILFNSENAALRSGFQYRFQTTIETGRKGKMVCFLGSVDPQSGEARIFDSRRREIRLR